MDNQPAFPGLFKPSQQQIALNMREHSYLGMTLRDYFAAKAMQGWMAHFGMTYSSEQETAEQAYVMADAMLKARQE